MSGGMEYLPFVQQKRPAPTDGALKYHGAVADGYDAKRQSDAKWTVEQEIIENLLSDLKPGSWVLDAPCGSGRFLKYCFDRQLIYRGIDISEDMIQKAVEKIGNRCPVFKAETGDGKTVEVPQVAFDRGDVLAPNVPDRSVDAALCIRITRWLSVEQCQQMFREMQRIARKRIILTARVANHPYARPLAIFEDAMGEDWYLEYSAAGAKGPADQPVEDPDYRIFCFKRRQEEVMKSPAAGESGEPSDKWTIPPYKAA